MATPAVAGDSAAAPAQAPARIAAAVALAWLVPGLGHILLGQHRRGLVFAAIVWGCFGLGMAHDGRLALRDARQPFLTTLQVVANAGVGPADMIARKAVYGAVVYRLGDLRPTPESARRGETFRSRARSGVSIYGTAYLWTAGLMNLLLLFDVWDVGRGRTVASPS